MSRTGRSEKASEETVQLVILIGGLLVGAFIILLLLRTGIGRGLPGLILAGLAALLIAYWMKELRKTVRREMFPSVSKQKKDWVYDLIEGNGQVIFVAEVPGPEDQVKVKLVDNQLKIAGGRGFLKEVSVPKNLEIVQMSYNNGVLNIRMSKPQR